MIKMKKTTSLIIVMLVISVNSEDTYDKKYDYFDIGPLVENDRILLNFTRCFLDQGPCTPDAKSFKKIIPEALSTACGKCTPKQKQLIKTVIKALMDRHPEAWESLVDKFDRERQYKKTFDNFLQDDEQ